MAVFSYGAATVHDPVCGNTERAGRLTTKGVTLAASAAAVLVQNEKAAGRWENWCVRGHAVRKVRGRQKRTSGRGPDPIRDNAVQPSGARP